MDLALVDLVRRGYFARAETLLKTTKSVAIEAVILRAEVAERVGRRDDARRLANQVLRDPAVSGPERARCLTLLGHLALEDGRPGDAVRVLGEAISAAKESDAIEELCWAELKLITALMEQSPGEAALAPLADLRRHVMQAGNPLLTAALHVLVSELNARCGAITAAQRHARVATALLERHANEWLRGLAGLAEMCAWYLCFEMDAALRAAATTLQSASESGHERTRLATYINLGHIDIARDELDRADRCLANAWRICHISPRCREPLIGALAELELARGNYPKCQTLLEQLWEINSPPHSHSKLWAYRTEIDMLAQRGRWSEALRAADRAIVEASRANSSRIHLLLRLQKAEVRAVLGDVVGVIRDVTDALSEQEDHSVEVLAEVQRVVGRALSRAGDIQAARDALKRSRRIFTALGNRRAARDLVRLEREERLEAASDEHRPAIRPDLLLRRFAAILQQATRADLLGVEALELLLEAGVAQRVAVAFKPPSKPLTVHHAEGWTAAEVRAAAERDGAVLPLGTWRDAEWMLVADVPQTVAARAAWLALQTIVRSGLELAEARREARERQALWPIENPDAPSHGVFGSEQMTELLRITKRIATTDVTVLITGETGVGKEVLARVLHDASPRAGKPFVPLNCSAVPRDMLEAQLFGHRRGAFTGADSAFPGVLRAAAGGTVFLDEIGEVSLDLQPKLLRFLESGEVHPLGEPQPVKVNVRVVAATNQDLDRLVREGRFREDLYYRLNVIHLKVPPLRERREEIPLLVSHFLERFAREFNKGRLRIADETMEYFVLHGWPGNVRELANEVRRLAALAEPDAVLMPEHLSPALSAGRRTRPASERDLMPTELVVRLDQPLAAATEHLERAMIQHAMALCNGRVDQVARMLGLSRKGLYLKRQRLKLDAFAS